MASNEPRSKAEAPPNATFDLGKVPMEYPEDGVFETYANVVNMNWTLTDVRLRFSQLVQVPDEDRPNWENQHSVVLERAAITIPWHQAKVLRDMLNGLISNYEEINGELKPLKLPGRPEASRP
jgi:hypothetical protein